MKKIINRGAFLLCLVALLGGSVHSAVATGNTIAVAPGVTLNQIDPASSNINSISQGAIVSRNGSIYTCYVNGSMQVVVARSADSGQTWQRTVIHSGNADDTHNTCNLGLDSAGYIHVAYDMHSTPLNYQISTLPYDVTNFKAGGSMGITSQLITYPEFYLAPDGTLYFFYRDGSSGNGDLDIRTYSTTTHQWSVFVAPLLQGYNLVPSDNAYVSVPTFDAAGNIYMAWVYRIGLYNYNLSYGMYKKSIGRWVTSAGVPYTLPITRLTSETVLATTANDGLSNVDISVTLDAANHPHIVFLKYSPQGHREVFHSYFNGSSWITTQVTHFNAPRLSGCPPSPPYPSDGPPAPCDMEVDGPAAAIDAQGNIYVLVGKAVGVPSLAGFIRPESVLYWLRSSDNGATWTNATAIPLSPSQRGAEFVYDRDYFKATGQFRILFQAVTNAVGPMYMMNIDPRALQLSTLPLQGAFDGVDNTSGLPVLKGWVADPNQVAQSVKVSLYLNGPYPGGTFAGEITASDPRADVAAIYPGNHGFSLAVPSTFLDGGTHSAYLYATGYAGTSTRILPPFAIPGTPQSIVLRNNLTALRVITPAAGAAYARGASVPIQWNYAAGIVAPFSIALDGSAGHTTIASGLSAAAAGCVSGGNCAYNWTATLAGTGDRITVTDAAGHQAVSGTFTINNPSVSLPFQGAFDGVDNTSGLPILKGWVVDPNKVSTSVSVSLYLDAPFPNGTLVGEIAASDPRADVSAIYPGNHGFSFHVPASVANGAAHIVYLYATGYAGTSTRILPPFAIPGTPQSIVLRNSGTTTLVCISDAVRPAVGQRVSFSALGATGAVSWTASPDGNPAVGTGSPFFASFPTPGDKRVTATSNGQIAICTLNIPTPVAPGPVATSTTPVPAPATGLQGSVSINTASGMIQGWAVDPTQTSKSLNVAFYLDMPFPNGSLAGEVTAGDASTAANAAGYAGNHGFSFPIPSWYKDGKPHTIYAYATAVTQGNVRISPPFLIPASPVPFALSNKVSILFQGNPQLLNQTASVLQSLQDALQYMLASISKI